MLEHFTPRKLGPLRLLKDSLVSYQLEFPINLIIHSIIDVWELESYYEDNFRRKQDSISPRIINEEEESRWNTWCKMEWLSIIRCILRIRKQS